MAVVTTIKNVFDRIRGKQAKPDLAERTPSSTMNAMSDFVKQVKNPDKVLLHQSNEGYQLYLDMPDRDPDLAGIIEQRSLAVASKPWEIQAFDESQESQDIANFCEKCLEAIPEFTKVRQRMAETFWTGFSVAEVIWRITDQGAVVVQDIRDRHNNRFAFHVDGHLQYKLKAFATDWHDAEPMKFLVLTYNKKGENPYGTAVAKACYFYWWVKLDAGMKNWAIATEKFAMPTPHIKYKSNISDKEKASIIDAKDTIMADQSFASSDNVEIDLLEAMRQSGAPYRDVCEYVNAAYGRRILGGTLTSSEGSKGTQALGSVHSDIRDDFIQNDAESLMAVFNTLLSWLVDFNFPNALGYPKFIIQYEPEKDRSADADVIKKYVDMGLPVGVEHAYEASTIPKPDNDEELLKPATPVAVDPAAPGNEPEPKPKPKQDQQPKAAASDLISISLSADDAAKLMFKFRENHLNAILSKDTGKSVDSSSTFLVNRDPGAENTGDVAANRCILLAEDPEKYLPGLPPVAEPIEGQPVAVQPNEKLKRYHVGAIAEYQDRSYRELLKVFNGFARAILSEFGQLPGGGSSASQIENMQMVMADLIESDFKPNLRIPLSNANRNVIRAAARQMAQQLGTSFNAGVYESLVGDYLRVHAFESVGERTRAMVVEEIGETTRRMFSQQVQNALSSGGNMDEMISILRQQLPNLSQSRASVIAITETRAAANWSVLEMGIRSGLDLEAWWIVDPESCVLCQERASRNPYPLRVAQSMGIVHPNCNDYFLLTPREAQ